MNAEEGTLLVVDDNEMNRDMLARRLQRRGYSVQTAEDGYRALEMITTSRFDLVLLDIMMPGIDGLEVLERIRRNRSVADLPVIMATAKDRSEDVVRALREGANDYVTKPLDFPVVVARVKTQLALKRAKRALEAAHARMKSDLEAAAKIQRALIPQSLPTLEGTQFAWKFEPCDELAGDILDVVELDETSVGLYLLDVSGHGVPAALLSVTLSRVLSHMADGSFLFQENRRDERHGGAVSPVKVAEQLNRQFPMDVATHQYFTFLYGVLDRNQRTFRYVSAGHPGPIHVRPHAEPEMHSGEGFAIGWFPEPGYEERSISLAPGDRLYFYSDGMIEAKNPDLEMFTQERLARAFSDNGHLPLDDTLHATLDSVKTWRGETEPDDDISLLAFEVTSE